MKAQEIIQQIKSLPPEEISKIVNFFYDENYFDDTIINKHVLVSLDGSKGDFHYSNSFQNRKLSLEEFRQKAAQFRKEVGPQKTNSADLIREDRDSR